MVKVLSRFHNFFLLISCHENVICENSNLLKFKGKKVLFCFSALEGPQEKLIENKRQLERKNAELISQIQEMNDVRLLFLKFV